MKKTSLVRVLRCVIPAAGLLAVNGCLATLQQNLDLLLSPTALDNAMRLPYSAVWPIAEFLLKFVHG